MQQTIHIDLKLQSLFFPDIITEIGRGFIEKPDYHYCQYRPKHIYFRVLPEAAVTALVISSITIFRSQISRRGKTLRSTDIIIFANVHPGELFQTSFNDSLNRFILSLI
jgi:hypothetical protein